MAASMPLRIGMEMSVTMISGCVFIAASIRDRPFETLPVTSYADPNKDSTICVKPGWSSANNTLILLNWPASRMRAFRKRSSSCFAPIQTHSNNKYSLQCPLVCHPAYTICLSKEPCMLSTLPVGTKSALQGAIRILVLKFSRGETSKAKISPVKTLSRGWATW